MRTRLAGLFVLSAAAALAFPNPDGGCQITTPSLLPAATEEIRVTYTIAFSGCTTPFLRVEAASGWVPNGLEFRQVGNTVQLTGTPFQWGDYAFSLRLVDQNYRVPSKAFVLKVVQPVHFRTQALASGVSGQAYSDQLRVRGGVGPFTYSVVEGSIPAGLTLNTSTGAITGTTPATRSTFRIRVTDSSVVPATAEHAYSIVPAGAITTTSTPPVGTVGSAYNFDIDGSLGATGFAVALGELPGGLTMNTSGVISGTPTAAGEYHFTVRQTVGSTSAWRSYRVFINEPMTINGAPRPAEESFAYDHTIVTYNSIGPFTYALTSGTLPTGMFFDSATGALYGEYPVGGPPEVSLSFTVTDATGQTSAPQSFSLTRVTRMTGSVTPIGPVAIPMGGSATPYTLTNGYGNKRYSVLGGLGGGGQNFFAVEFFTGQANYGFNVPGTHTPVVLATDELGAAVVLTGPTFTAIGPPRLNDTELPNGTVGTVYSATPSATNLNFTPVTWSVSGSLPAGLTLNTSTGQISGTPTAGGTLTSFTITVTDAQSRSANREYSIGVAAGAVQITTTSVAAATTTQAYSQTLQSTAATAGIWTLSSGTLPPGITLSTTGLLSGTPTTAGSYSIVVNVTLATTGVSDRKAFTIHVADPISLSAVVPSPSEQTLNYSIYSGLNVVGGRAPFTFTTVSGALPPGAYYDPNNAAINGDAFATGSYSFTIRVTDADGRTANLPYVINIRTMVSGTNDYRLPTSVLNAPYSVQLGATGGLAPYTFAPGLYGILPAGVTISPTGLLSGTPTVSGFYSVSVQIADAGGRTWETEYGLAIGEAMVITNTPPLPAQRLLNSYNATINTTGGVYDEGGFIFDRFEVISGNLPPLLKLDSFSGLIDGLPLVPGTYNFTVRAQDSYGRAATQATSITIGDAFTIGPATLPNGALTRPYSVTLTSPGAATPVTWSQATGNLPPGITLAPTTGVLSGTPTQLGTFSFAVQALDQTGIPVIGSYSITISNPLTISPTTLPGGTIGSLYSQQLTASTTAPLTWSVSAGTLPAGLTLNPSTGLLSGTPTAAATSNFTVLAVDSLGVSGERAYSVTVTGNLTVNPATLPVATVGTLYSQTLTATGATGAVTWSIVSNSGLPPGITFNTGTGLLSGTPTTPGLYFFDATAVDSVGARGSRSYTLQVSAVLTINPATLLPGTINVPYSQALTVSGATGAVSFAVTQGFLPTGITIANGALTGTPVFDGNYSFQITATDSLNQTSVRNYTLFIRDVLQISQSSLPPANVGVPYSVTLSVAIPQVGPASLKAPREASIAPRQTPAPPYNFAVTAGTLPAGLTLTSAGLLSGTPTTAGSYNFTVTVTDSLGQSGTATYTLSVQSSLEIAPAVLPAGIIGTAYNQTLTVNGLVSITAVPTVAWSVSAGALPPGLGLNGASGALTGTPTTAGTFSFTVLAQASNGQTGSRAYQLIVVEPLAITTASLPEASQNEAYSVTLASNSLPSSAVTWTVAGGTLPAGLTLAPSTGVIGGTPTAQGTQTFTVQAANTLGQTATKVFTLSVVQAVSILSQSLGEAEISRPYDVPLNAVGGQAPYTWAITSTLPAGLTFSTTGRVTGTPTGPVGSYPQTVRVTDARGRSATKTLPLQVLPAPPATLALTPETMPNGRVNEPYSVGVSATGGTPGYTITVSQGNLPPGLTLFNNLVSGRPTQEGTFRFGLNVTDSAGRSAGTLYTVTIEAALTPLVVTPSSIAATTQLGQPFSVQFGATGGRAPYLFAISGNVPPGTSFNSNGTLAGTPSQGGTYAFTIEVTDALRGTASRGYSVTVTGNLVITTQAPLRDGTVGAGYGISFGATGGRPPYTWALSGNVPGLTFDPSTGELTGTPTTAGTFPISVEVRDQQRLSASAGFSITIFDRLEITNAPGAAALVVGTPYSFGFTTRGGKPPVTLSVIDGALPPGLAMSGSGEISGTPSTAGTYAFTVQAADSLGNRVTRGASLRVVAALTITTTSLPAGAVGTAYSAGVAASGGVAPIGAFSVSAGSLPAGLSLAADGSISGTPTVAGTSSFTVQVSDAAGTVATRALSITINLPPVPPLSFVGLPQALPPGTQTNITIQLAQPFPVPVTGTLTLIFEPNALNNADDPSVQFSSGGRTVTFTIPAGQTSGTFPVSPLRLLSGTVAGNIRIVTSTSPASATPVPDTVLPIARTAPVITAGTAQLGTNAFTLVIDGFSNTREIQSATFRLTPAPGAPLQTTEVPVSVAATFNDYFRGAASVPFGGQFRLTLPFNVSGSLSDIESVVVTVTNSVGTSQPFTVRLR